jgi:beta-galactosidase
MAAKYPEIIADTGQGREKYGRRQNMDITNPGYLFYAERIIRKLMEACIGYPNVIGVQLDNETKHYQTSGQSVQRQFVRHLRDLFKTTDEMNRAFGFNYWSNRVDAWENVPDVTGAINGSFKAEFERFRRNLASGFLMWQREIVGQYLRKDQFITHNFDFDWRDHSYGVQPDVNHKQAADAVSIAGCDIYHPSQERLSGAEIAFCGALAYNLKNRGYLVLETQAQGLVQWTPYAGQLRLQGFSHLAAGACGVMYWHWHSTHHSQETFWKGVLSHDLEPNETYWEICGIGKDIARIGAHLKALEKKNEVAILVSNESLTGIQIFPFPDKSLDYNDVVRWLYDALYEMNIEADILFPEDMASFGSYKMLLVPALYSASDSLLEALEAYAMNGGFLVSTFKSGYANEFLEARNCKMPVPHCFGVHYDTYTPPRDVALKGERLQGGREDRMVSGWMEMLRPETADTLASYDHAGWSKYAGVTKVKSGKGTAVYIGCYMETASLKALLKSFLCDLGLWTKVQRAQFPVIIRSGINRDGEAIHFYMNYSGLSRKQEYYHGDGRDLLSDREYARGDSLTLGAWGVCVLKEN